MSATISAPLDCSLQEAARHNAAQQVSVNEDAENGAHGLPEPQCPSHVGLKILNFLGFIMVGEHAPARKHSRPSNHMEAHLSHAAAATCLLFTDGGYAETNARTQSAQGPALLLSVPWLWGV
jgi:hypothetical protein